MTLAGMLPASGERARPAWPSGQATPGVDPLGAVLDSLAALLCVVAGDRRVLYMNRAARESLARRDGFVLREGALHGAQPEITRRLDRALKAVCWRHAVRDAFQVHVAGQSLQVSVSALADVPACSPGGSSAALIAASHADASGHDEIMLRALFGLSRSEAAILKGLLDGKTLEQCAQSRGVATSTARSQLSSIFSKTNTTHQAQLISVAKALPVTTIRRDEGPCGDDWIMV